VWCCLPLLALLLLLYLQGVDQSLKTLKEEFPCLEVISLSGNFCTDKKVAAINWLEGRGKSVVCEAIIPGNVITKVTVFLPLLRV